MAAECSVLISKSQSGGVPASVQVLVADRNAALSNMATVSPHTKVFTVEAATFSLDPKPGVLPDCLVQMAFNHVFIPLSTLTTYVLNNNETNQDVKYKCIMYGTGTGKHFQMRLLSLLRMSLVTLNLGRHTQTGLPTPGDRTNSTKFAKRDREVKLPNYPTPTQS